ncbi:hypothetical protein JW960_00215 [candidate division KSB1 bacterium]|nr:hypothetical protein [candidate division KSB1 bacterium]
MLTDHSLAVQILNTKDSDDDLDQVVNMAISDAQLLETLRGGLMQKNEVYRYNCYKVLFRISQLRPDVLYPWWDFFVEHMESPNAYHRMAAIPIIAQLTKADPENRFDAVFSQFFSHLEDTSFIVARFIAQNAGVIAKARRRLQRDITQKLLTIEHTPHKHIDLLKSDAIESFTVYFDEAENKDAIIAFVKAEFSGDSPRCRKMAKAFLKQFHIA